MYVAEVVSAFAFLADDAGFIGPERNRHGIRWHHGTLRVEVAIPGFREPMVSTHLTMTARDGEAQRGICGCWLPEIYSAIGDGPARELPVDASTLDAALENVRKHAEVLRRALPLLLARDGELTPLGEKLAGRRWRDPPQAMR